MGMPDGKEESVGPGLQMVAIQIRTSRVEARSYTAGSGNGSRLWAALRSGIPCQEEPIEGIRGRHVQDLVAVRFVKSVPA